MKARLPGRAATRFSRVVQLLFVAALFGQLDGVGVQSTAASPNFEQSRDEVVRILSGFIKVDTTSPPGNETKGAEYLKAILDKEGIASVILEKEKGRGNLVARLKGGGRKKPLLLMGHLDVVGVERSQWTVDPFGGVIKDGYIYGRGAMDDKGMTTVCLEVLMLLHRLKVPLDRDVIFLAEAGEEANTDVGMDFMVREHWDKIACEFALNEGGGIREADGKVKYVEVATTEKVPWPGFLYAKGTSGHGSRPIVDNAIVHLANAVSKLAAWQPPMRLNETTREYLSRRALIGSPELAYLYEHVEHSTLSLEVQEKVRVADPKVNAILRTTVAPTVMEGGFRINVIPGDARARLDIRALPDEDMDALAAQMRKIIDNPRVELVASKGPRNPAPPSRLDTEMFQSLERAQKKLFVDAITLPAMQTGATDSAFLREKGVQAYGINTVLTEQDALRGHGNDERASIHGLGLFLQFLWEAVVDVAAAKAP